MDETYGIVEGSTLRSFDNLAGAKAFAVLNSSYLINEAYTRHPPTFCVKGGNGTTIGHTARDPVRVAVEGVAVDGVAWRVHVGPLNVVIGLGCSSPPIREQRIRECVDVMAEQEVSRLIFVGNSTEESVEFYRCFGAHAHRLPIQLMGAVNASFDARSKTTLGNARFAMENIMESLISKRPRHICIHLVTSEFHMERSRMIFLRAAQVFLNKFLEDGFTYELRCHPCIHCDSEVPEKYIGSESADKLPTHIQLEQRQRDAYNKSSEDEVLDWE